MIVLLVTALIIWFVWGAIFDPEDQLGPVEKAIRHPGKWSTKVITGWIEDAENVLKDPMSTNEEKEKAMKDIEYFSGLINGKRE